MCAFASPVSLFHKELTWGQFIIQRQEEPAAPNKKSRGGAEPASKPTAGFDAFDDDDVSALRYWFLALFFWGGGEERPMNGVRLPVPQNPSIVSRLTQSLYIQRLNHSAAWASA